MTTNPLRADDALKYAAALLKARADYVTERICGADESTCIDGHETEMDMLDDIRDVVMGLAARFGDPLRYSDGRRVKSLQEIQLGMHTEHIWHPIPGQERPLSWRGDLLSFEPDVPSPGVYQVTLHPQTQEIQVDVVRVDS